MDEALKLTVPPEALAREFIPLLAIEEERSFLQLAKGLGSKDTSRPQRVVEKYLDALEIFGLAVVSTNGALLTPRGLRFRSSSTAQKVVRSAFYAGRIPSSVIKVLSTTSALTHDEARRRLAAVGRDAELDRWLEWLKYSGIISVTNDMITINSGGNRPIDLYIPEEMSNLQEERYRHLAAIGYADPGSDSSDCFQSVFRLVKDFRTGLPEKAEATMRRLVRCLLAGLGIVAQIDNGPRETSPTHQRAKVQFGTQGDDAVGFFLRPPSVSAEESIGLVLAMELKRAASDKKAVGQAVTAAGRWRTYFEGKPTVMAITISDSETYSEKAAREYATSNGVIHLPIESLVQLASLQKDRFLAAKSLVMPVHIWTLLDRFEKIAYAEPTAQDIMEGITDLLDG